MLLKHAKEIEKEVPTMKGVKNVALQWLITRKDGAPRYAMRLFTIEPGGTIPLHSHDDMEHEMYVVEGRAVMRTHEGEQEIITGDALLVKAGDQHGFENKYDEPFKFICVVPV